MSDRVSVDPVIVTCAVRYALGVAWCDEHGVPVHRLPLAWGSTTTLARLRSWLDGLAVGTEVER